MNDLSREQEGFLEDLALREGRICVRAGYADQSVRATTRGGVTYVVDADAVDVKVQTGTNYIDWREDEQLLPVDSREESASHAERVSEGARGAARQEHHDRPSDRPGEEAEMALRELNERMNDNLRVTLYWDAEKDTMTVEVEDHRDRGEDLRLTDIPPADAHKAFMHPFSYSKSRMFGGQSIEEAAIEEGFRLREEGEAA